MLPELYDMVEKCTIGGDGIIASWTEDGRSFLIKDEDAFEKQIMPKYLEASKFASFVRQLSFYGFSKMQVRGASW